jgi:pilus assembly protein CpaC
MHPTTFLCRALRPALLFALTLCVLAPVASAQDAKPVPITGRLLVPIDGTQRLQMTKKQVIAKAINRNEAVLRVSAVYGDPTTVLITGLTPGVGIITLIDEKNVEENFEVLIQRDVEYLRSILKRAVPTANIDPIPGANNSIILRGTVARAEDIQIIMEIAENVSPRQIAVTPSGLGGLTPSAVPVGPPRIINAMRVAGVQQVQLCVVIAAVNRTETRRLGFSFIENGNKQFAASTVAGGASLLNTILASPHGSNATLTGSPDVVFGVIGNHESFLGVLDALRQEGVTKILSEPRVVTLSGQLANIVSGGETPILTASQGGPTVTYKQFGTVLSVVPLVLGDGRIHMQVNPQQSQLNQANGVSITSSFGPTVVPGFDTRSASVTVEMGAGETLVIGGLIEHTVNGTTSKIPFIGDLPYVGAAFRTVSYLENEQELLVMVTPHLVDPMSCDQLPKYLPGMETRAPDDCELFLEGILEAPRGPRTPWQGGHYSAPYKSGPSAMQFPCGNNPGGGANGGCANGGCGNPVGGAAPPLPPVPVDSHAATPPVEAPKSLPTADADAKDAGPATLPPIVK